MCTKAIMVEGVNPVATKKTVSPQHWQSGTAVSTLLGFINMAELMPGLKVPTERTTSVVMLCRVTNFSFDCNCYQLMLALWVE